MATFNHFPAIAAALHRRAADVVDKTTFDLEGHIKANIVAVDAVDTGFMLNTTQGEHAPGALEGTVGTAADYWPYPNYGTAHMPARPFVEPAIDAVRPGFEAALERIFD